MAEEPHLLTEESKGLLIATLNRPDKLNAMSGQMMALFENAVHRFRDSPELKVMLIRASGRYFCSGADLRAKDSTEMVGSARSIRETHRLGFNGMQRIYNEMEHIETPFVVAHHAACVGGGLELSLSCDFRIAAESASYSLPEGKFGTLPASNGVSRLTRIVGTHWARLLVMANRTVNSGMAHTMGLVHEVYPDASFSEEVMSFCRHLAEQHGEQMGAAKIAIELAHDLSRDQGRHVERLANSALMLNPEYLETIAAYVAKFSRSEKV